MRLFLFVLIVSSFAMCKSKDKIPTGESLKYVVLLEKDATVKVLAKSLDHKIIDSKRSSRSQNQWTIEFENEGKKSKNIKRDLLNNDLVISVYDEADSENMNSKSSKKSKVSPIKESKKQ